MMGLTRERCSREFSLPSLCWLNRFKLGTTHMGHFSDVEWSFYIPAIFFFFFFKLRLSYHAFIGHMGG